jgi:UDP-2,3-diacylglucosamine pyrophosphatase LpxH
MDKIIRTYDYVVLRLFLFILRRSHKLYYTASNLDRLIEDKFERRCKKAVVAQSRYYWHLPEGTEKAMKNYHVIR